MKILANSSENGNMPKIKFVRSEMPEIQETCYPSQGNLAVNKSYDNSKIKTGVKEGVFTGYSERPISTQDHSSVCSPAKQKIMITGTTIGSSTYGTNIYVPCPVGYNYTISGVELYYSDASVATATITLYTDSTKATKIYEFAKIASTGIKVDVKDVNSLLNIYTVTELSNPLYIEVIPTGSIGTPLVSILLTLISFY